MACLSPTEDVREAVYRRLEFTAVHGRRRHRLHLGLLNARQAVDFKRRIEEIIQDLQLGNPHTASLCDWMNRLDPKFQRKLAKKGLMKSARPSSELGDFLDGYFDKLHVSPSTRANYGRARCNLIDHFGGTRPLMSIGPTDADGFKMYLESLTRSNGQPLLAKATIGGRIKIARRFFTAAKKLIDENPFANVRGGGQVNPARLVFVEAEVADRLIDMADSQDWKVVIALARYGGIRIPSELEKLEWRHVNWKQKKILIHAKKTQRYEGKEIRWVPMYDELFSAMNAARLAAPPDATFVIGDPKLRRSPNLRTGFIRQIKRAGIAPWPKPFQNMRSTRETELIERDGLKSACAIIGNSEKVALAHYLQLRPDYLVDAIIKDRAGRKAEEAQRQLANTTLTNTSTSSTEQPLPQAKVA